MNILNGVGKSHEKVPEKGSDHSSDEKIRLCKYVFRNGRCTGHVKNVVMGLSREACSDHCKNNGAVGL